MAFRRIFTNFNQGRIRDGILTPVNGKLQLLSEFRRSFILKTNRLRNDSVKSSSKGLSSNSGNDFLLNFGSNI
jgi:hypothetical protein